MEISGNKLSVVFTARFSDGSEKMLRTVQKNRGIMVKSEIGKENEAVLAREDCPLYYKNWENVPVFGDFKKHYPC